MKVMCKKNVCTEPAVLSPKVTRTIYPNRSEVPVHFQSCLIHCHKNAVGYHSRRKNLCQSEDIERVFFFSKFICHVDPKTQKLFSTAYLNMIALEAEVITVQNRVASWLKSMRIPCWICSKEGIGTLSVLSSFGTAVVLASFFWKLEYCGGWNERITCWERGIQMLWSCYYELALKVFGGKIAAMLFFLLCALVPRQFKIHILLDNLYYFDFVFQCLSVFVNFWCIVCALKMLCHLVGVTET